MNTTEIKISELPEEVTEDGLKIYGPTSYETQVAILSHYLHTLDGKHDIASGEKRYEYVIFSIRLKENVGKEYYAKYFEPIENATLVTPRKYHINPQFLEWHRDCIFNK